MPFGKYYPPFCQPCSTIELELITPEVVVYGSKMPRWVEPMPSLICVNRIIFTGHTHLVFHQIVLHVHIIFNRAVNVRLCIGEVGVDLELCVHAHRHNVDLIMEASLKIN
jgi:hypothetical protein